MGSASKGSKKKKVKTAVILQIHHKLQAAAYARGGQNWQALFKILDKDHGGTLSAAEWLSACRKQLKIPPGEMSDETIGDFFNRLDEDDSGTIAVQEVVHFLQEGPSFFLD